MVSCPAPGLAIIRYNGDEALWTRCRLRKHTKCADLNFPLAPGEDAYRPTGNKMYRMMRLSVLAVED